MDHTCVMLLCPPYWAQMLWLPSGNLGCERWIRPSARNELYVAQPQEWWATFPFAFCLRICSFMSAALCMLTVVVYTVCTLCTHNNRLWIWKLKFIGACYVCVCGLITLILCCSVVRLRMFCCQLVCGRYFCSVRIWLMGLSQRRKGVLFAWRNTRLRNFCGSWLASESPPQSS